MEDLKNIVIDLISLKQEGSYWDFKLKWYESDKNTDLLHDIICMSNNLANKHALIIIGVDEEDDYSIKSVLNDSRRKNTQKIVDFLKDIKFASDIRPIVYVETVSLDEEIIDVIVIQNSYNTPFYLKERYLGVNANHIYTRIQDTNTPINSSADIDKIEWLWKKRFGLIETPLVSLETFIGQPHSWIDGPYGEMQKYYIPFPEYTLEYEFASDCTNGYVYYLFSQCDSTPKWMNIKIHYHQTLLMQIRGVLLDGNRYMTPCPLTDSITSLREHNLEIMYKYMVEDSFLYKLHQFFVIQEPSSDAQIAHDKFVKVILIFINEEERSEFKKYVVDNWKYNDKYKKMIHSPYIPQIKGYKKDAFKEDYENALILNLMLTKFRNETLR